MNAMSKMIRDLKISCNCLIVVLPCLAANSAQGHTEILQEVLNEMSGKSFTAQDPDDGRDQS